MVAPSSTSNSTPTGSNRTVWMSVIFIVPLIFHSRFQPASCGEAAMRGLSGSFSVARIDRGALALFSDMGIPLGIRHRTQRLERRSQGVAPDMLQLPHVLVVEPQVRLRHQGLSIVTHEVEILDRIGEIPAIIEGLPLALARELAHGRRRSALVLVGKGLDSGPTIQFMGEGVPLAVDLVDNHVLADEARHQARPATVRIGIADILVEDQHLLARTAELVIPFPEVAEFGVPARILVLEPLKVLLGLG